MIIIISGCDRVGKTTFCNQLRKQLPNYKYIHFTAPKTEQEGYNKYLNFINQLDNTESYIIDRFYESEAVYAPIYRNYTITYRHQFDKLLRDKYKILFLYMKSDLDIIKQRINDIGDDFINVDDVEKIYYNYENYMQSIQLPYLILNNNSFSDLKNNINLCLETVNNYNFTSEYFGNLQANKAVIFLNNIKDNIHDYIVFNGPKEELKIKKNINKDIEEDYIIYKEKINKLVNYTEYFYTNDDNNVNLLNINERLYVN